MPFPSVLSTFNRPTSTDRLNSPSHSALHNTVSSALGQVEAVIGVEGDSSVVGTLEYLIKSPASDGGGHVQTVNKGGTGQTSYTKGDILVAQSSSVLTKLAVGTNDYIIVADSAQATGIKWASADTVGGGKISISGSVLSVTNSSAETSVLSATVPASTIGTNNAVKATLFVQNISANTSDTLLVKAHYGTSSVTTTLTGVNDTTGFRGKIEWHLIGANAVNSQRANLIISAFKDNTLITKNTSAASIASIHTYDTGILTEDSGAAKTIGMTVKWSAASGDDDFDTGGWTVEKITS